MPSLSEIAKHIGVSKPRAGQLKQQGMPTNTLRAAKLWRDRQQRKREATNAKTANVQKGKRGRPRNISKPSDTGDTLEDSLRDAITVAKDAFIAYQDALRSESSSTSARLSEFNKALRGRQDAERLYREELERRGVLVNKGVMSDKIRRCMEAMIRRLRKLPTEGGPQCNEQDPIKAVRILQTMVDEILIAGQEALRDL